MTVGELKEMLSQCTDDALVWIDDGTGIAVANGGFVDNDGDAVLEVEMGE